MKHLVLLLSACLALAALATNRNYCRVADGAKSLVYAPDYLYPSWSAPTAADYLAANWLRNAVTPPETREGYYATLDSYEARDGAVYAVYAYTPIPYTPRRFYKYDVSAACDEYGELDNFIALVSADAKTKWFYDQAEILVENDPFFVGVTNAVISSGAMTEAKVRQILDRAYELGKTTTNAEAK